MSAVRFCVKGLSSIEPSPVRTNQIEIVCQMNADQKLLLLRTVFDLMGHIERQAMFAQLKEEFA